MNRNTEVNPNPNPNPSPNPNPTHMRAASERKVRFGQTFFLNCRGEVFQSIESNEKSLS